MPMVKLIVCSKCDWIKQIRYEGIVIGGGYMSVMTIHQRLTSGKAVSTDKSTI